MTFDFVNIFKIVSTPDLQIIDYAVGLPGSQHDATAFSADPSVI